MGSRAPNGRLDVLVVSSWFPGFDDPIAGRFVADQVEALSLTGGVAPAVVSFEAAGLIGGGPFRTRLARAVSELAGEAVRTRGDVFAPHGNGLEPAVPVARLVVPSGRHPAAGAAHGAVAIETALAALGDRWFDKSAGAGVAPLAIPRPRLIHAHTVYPDGAGAVALARRLGCPLVITEHASFVGRLIGVPEIRRRYVEAVSAAARLIVVSHSLARELVAALPEVEPKIVVIPNAVAVEAFSPRRANERGRDELLFVGLRKDTKGIATLLEAVAQVHRERPEVRLRLVGRSPTDEVEARWRRLSAELGIAEVVTFDGPAVRSGVAAALSQAALFVHPSPRETFGVVAAEALAAGVPVVATDSGGVTEILGDDPDALGALVPAGDATALGAAIVRTLDRLDTFDPSVLRRSVEQRFGRAAVAARLRELYDAVGSELGGSGPARADAPSSPPAAGSPEPVRVVVAFDPARARLIDGLPAALRSRIVLVSSADPDGPKPAGLLGVVATDMHGRLRATADALAIGPPVTGVRRILRAFRHPLAVARRRGILPGLESLITVRGATAVSQGLALARERAGAMGDPPELVCVDGVDHLAAAAIVAAGDVHLAPGGLRWLGDRVVPGDEEARRA